MTNNLLDMVDRIEELEEGGIHHGDDEYTTYETLKTQFFSETMKREDQLDQGKILDHSMAHEYDELRSYIEEKVDDLEVDYSDF